MPHRYQAQVQQETTTTSLLGHALRSTFRAGYGFTDVRHDILAGMVVGIVALPLSMALAIASGVPPQHGLYTAMVAGGLIALLGGSRAQVSGPTAAFVVILAPISAKFGIGGLMMASVLAGGLLLIMGMARLGRLIEFIPYPVTTGFTAGIAVVIATLQLKDFLGLTVPHMPEHYLERVYALVRALPSLQRSDLGIGLFTLLILMVLPRYTHRIPAPLVALPLAAVVAYVLAQFVHGFHVDTINSRFSFEQSGVTMHGIPRSPPTPLLPWNMPGPDGAPFAVSLDLVRNLAGSAFAIAMLGAIESLLSAVVADGMMGTRHNPDAELMAQGIGNLVAPFFGGFAATGAIARTATNIRAGARSPLSSFFHAVFILVTVVLLAPILGYLPMASLAALLMIVAWNMSEVKHFGHTLRVAPRGDVFVLLTCFSLTVLFDMVVSVTAGVMLAALLFMRRMAEVSGTQLVGDPREALGQALPRGVLVYQIAGPLFFGAAQKAMSSLRTIQDGVRVVVLDMRSVPVMDATGLVNLESAIDRLKKAKVFTVLGGVQHQPLELMAKAGWKHREYLGIYGSFEHALDLARWHAVGPSEVPVADALETAAARQ